jgi:hypothetical protein
MAVRSQVVKQCGSARFFRAGEVAAAAAVVAGLRMVAKIQATQFAKGGSFKMPGGISGSTVKWSRWRYRRASGSTVTPASQMRDRSGRAPVIEVGAVGMGDFITGRNLRDLIEP